MLTKDELAGLEEMVRRVVREEVTTLGTALLVFRDRTPPTPESVERMLATWGFNPFSANSEKSVLP